MGYWRVRRGWDSKMKLALYFQGEQIDRAFAKYSVFIGEKKPKWQFGQKGERLELYRLADDAFDPSCDEDQRRESFDGIYKALRGGWGVFRTSRPLGYWLSDRTFSALLGLQTTYGRSSGLTLLNLEQVESRRAIIHCLQKMSGLKPLTDGGTSIMAVSKFLHFFNPRLFPIWDTGVIQNQVLRTFVSDWTIPAWAGGPKVDLPTRQYLGYVLLANRVMRQEPQVVMRKLVDWVARQAGVEGDSKALPPGLHNYYSTAFEFIAIGASEIETGDP
jgi:hypothetical protein